MLEYNQILDQQTVKLEQLRKFAEMENLKSGFMNDFPNTEAFWELSHNNNNYN